jgi:ABC-type multidrug transport system fused ATPase/permease subunit
MPTRLEDSDILRVVTNSPARTGTVARPKSSTHRSAEQIAHDLQPYVVVRKIWIIQILSLVTACGIAMGIVLLVLLGKMGANLLQPYLIKYISSQFRALHVSRRIIYSITALKNLINVLKQNEAENQNKVENDKIKLMLYRLEVILGTLKTCLMSNDAKEDGGSEQINRITKEMIENVDTLVSSFHYGEGFQNVLRQSIWKVINYCRIYSCIINTGKQMGIEYNIYNNSYIFEDEPFFKDNTTNNEAAFNFECIYKKTTELYNIDAKNLATLKLYVSYLEKYIENIENNLLTLQNDDTNDFKCEYKNFNWTPNDLKEDNVKINAKVSELWEMVYEDGEVSTPYTRYEKINVKLNQNIQAIKNEQLKLQQIYDELQKNIELIEHIRQDKNTLDCARMGYATTNSNNDIIFRQFNYEEWLNSNYNTVPIIKDDLLKEIMQSLREKHEEVEKMITQTESSLTTINNNNNIITHNMKNTVEQIKKNKNQQADLQSKISKIKKYINTKNKNDLIITKKINEEKSKQQIIEQKKQQIIEQKKQQIIEQKTYNSQKNDKELKQLQEKMNDFVRNIETYNLEQENNNKELLELEKELQNLKHELDQIENSHNELRKNELCYTNELNDYSRQISIITNELNTNKKDLQLIKNNKEKLEKILKKNINKLESNDVQYIMSLVHQFHIPVNKTNVFTKSKNELISEFRNYIQLNEIEPVQEKIKQYKREEMNLQKTIKEFVPQTMIKIKTKLNEMKQDINNYNLQIESYKENITKTNENTKNLQNIMNQDVYGISEENLQDVVKYLHNLYKIATKLNVKSADLIVLKRNIEKYKIFLPNLKAMSNNKSENITLEKQLVVEQAYNIIKRMNLILRNCDPGIPIMSMSDYHLVLLQWFAQSVCQKPIELQNILNAKPNTNSAIQTKLSAFLLFLAALLSCLVGIVPIIVRVAEPAIIASITQQLAAQVRDVEPSFIIINDTDLQTLCLEVLAVYPMVSKQAIISFVKNQVVSQGLIIVFAIVSRVAPYFASDQFETNNHWQHLVKLVLLLSVITFTNLHIQQSPNVIMHFINIACVLYVVIIYICPFIMLRRSADEVVSLVIRFGIPDISISKLLMIGDVYDIRQHHVERETNMNEDHDEDYNKAALKHVTVYPLQMGLPSIIVFSVLFVLLTRPHTESSMFANDTLSRFQDIINAIAKMPLDVQNTSDTTSAVQPGEVLNEVIWNNADVGFMDPTAAIHGDSSSKVKTVLKGLNISLPTDRMTVVIGASGSGKSTLVNDYPRLNGQPVIHNNTRLTEVTSPFTNQLRICQEAPDAGFKNASKCTSTLPQKVPRPQGTSIIEFFMAHLPVTFLDYLNNLRHSNPKKHHITMCKLQLLCWNVLSTFGVLKELTAHSQIKALDVTKLYYDENFEDDTFKLLTDIVSNRPVLHMSGGQGQRYVLSLQTCKSALVSATRAGEIWSDEPDAGLDLTNRTKLRSLSLSVPTAQQCNLFRSTVAKFCPELLSFIPVDISCDAEKLSMLPYDNPVLAAASYEGSCWLSPNILHDTGSSCIVSHFHSELTGHYTSDIIRVNDGNAVYNDQTLVF